MHLFYTPDIEGDIYTLNADESRHCVRVLRLGAGSGFVGGWERNLVWGVIERAEVRGCEIRITDRRELYGGATFTLHLAVVRRRAWTASNGCWKMYRDGGIDEITFIACSSFRTEGCERRTAGKSDCGGDETQSLKAYLPRVNPDDRFPAVGHFLPGSPINLSPTVMKG